MKTFCGLWLVVLAAGPVGAQVYKCPDASGRLALQQTPCAGGTKLEVKPASGDAAPPAPTPPSPSAGANGAPKGYAEKLAEEREQRERWTRMNNAKLAADRERATCEKEQASIAAQKRSSNNSLAGAVRDTAISGEMQAAATMCLGRLRTLEGEVSRAEAECARSGCRPPGQ